MHSRSNDPFGDALAAGTAQIIDAVRSVAAANPVVLIDGRSGAGKTSIAARVVASWPLKGAPQRIALDSLYPGWDGLDAGVERALADILQPHGRGLVSTWRRWDWETQSEAESHAVHPALGIVLEGCGVLTPATSKLADVRVWVDAPEESRKRRALARDGDAFRPHWDRWAAQEVRHIERDDPRAHADIVLHMP